MAFIEVTGVSKSFPSATGGKHVLRDVSLAVDQGHFLSIVGAMGSGKSTLLSILAGLTRPDGGRIRVDGAPLTEIRRDMAYVFQNYSLLPWLTALENVRLAVGAALPELSVAEQHEQARMSLENVGLGNAIHRRPSQLSGGMRQRVAIARAFSTRPRLLLLDEPFGALDALTREALQQDLAQMCSAVDRPVTTIMITNSVEEALLLSDAIVPLLAGPPATLGTPIPIELPRPRTISQLAHDERATHVRAYVVATLTSALGRVRRHGLRAAPNTATLTTAVAEEGP